MAVEFIEFTFENIHSSAKPIDVLNIKRPILAPIQRKRKKVPGRPGEIDQGYEIDSLEIPIEVILRGDSVSNMRANIRDVASWLFNGGFAGRLVFDDEPDKYYLAHLSGKTDLDQILAHGRGELLMDCADPIAIGQTARQQIAGLGVGGMYSTINDFNLGTKTNTEAVVNGTAAELRITKYQGEIWSSLLLTAWELGTMNGMMEANDRLTLSRGAGANLTRSTTAEWDTGTLTNTDGVSNVLKLSNISSMNVRDNMSAWKNQGWTDAYYTSTRKGSVSQQSGYMRITKTGTGLNSTVMVMRNSSYQVSDRSNLLYIKTNTNQCRYQFVDNGTKLELWLPNTNNVWKWYRIDYATNSATLYALGSSTVVASATGASTSAQDRYGFILGDDETGTVEVSAVYYGPTSNLPAVTVTSLSGTAVYSVSLADVGNPGASILFYDWDITSAISSGHSVEVRTRTTKSGQTPSAWSAPLADGATIPGIAGNTWGAGDTLEVQITLITTDLGFSPEMVNLVADVPSTYVSSGTWKRTYNTFQSVTKAIRSLVEWTALTPTGTILEVWVTWTVGSTTYGPFQCTNGQPLPWLTTNQDLSTASFEIEVRATTTDSTLTPELTRLYMEMEPGYQPSGEWSAPGKAIGSIGVVGSSRIYWEERHLDPSKTSIEVYVGYSPTGPWTAATNGGELPGAEAGVDVTGKTVYIRLVLNSTDTLYTPALEMVSWDVSQFEDIDLTNNGTAAADAVFTGTVSNEASYLQILHVQTGRQLYLNRTFKPGDTFEINCESTRVTINGSALEGQKAFDPVSRWIELLPGYNSFEVQPSGIAEVFCDWTERWL